MYTTHCINNKSKFANLIRSGSKDKFLKTCRTHIGSELCQYSGGCCSRWQVLQHRRCGSRLYYITLIILKKPESPTPSNVTGRQRPLKTSSDTNNKAQCHKGVHTVGDNHYLELEVKANQQPVQLTDQ